jgi:hypothetical protein
VGVVLQQGYDRFFGRVARQIDDVQIALAKLAAFAAVNFQNLRQFVRRQAGAWLHQNAAACIVLAVIGGKGRSSDAGQGGGDGGGGEFGGEVLHISESCFSKILNKDCRPVRRPTEDATCGPFQGACVYRVHLSGSPAVIEPKLLRPMTLRPALSRGLPLSVNC